MPLDAVDDRGSARCDGRDGRRRSCAPSGRMPAGVRRPASGARSECVGHLIEADQRGFGGRIRTILGRGAWVAGRDLQAWDPPAVAASRPRPPPAADELIAEFAALRADGVAWSVVCGREDLAAMRRPSRGRRAAGRRAARRVGPSRPQPHPPDARRHAGSRSGPRWATRSSSASRRSTRLASARG